MPKIAHASFRACACLLLLSASTAALGQEYEVTTLEPSDSHAGNFSRAQSINNHGVVIGEGSATFTSGIIHIWRPGQFPEPQYLYAYNQSKLGKINDSGQFVGNVYQPDGWHGHLNSTDLGLGRANDINNKGQVVGWDWDSSYIYKDGVFDHLPTSYWGSEAYAINDSGIAAGYWISDCSSDCFEEICMFRNDSVIFLGAPVGNYGEAEDINNHGQIVGWYSLCGNCSQYRGFIWDQGTWTIIPTLWDSGGTNAHAINDQGVVVGETRLSGAQGFYPSAFIYNATHGIRDLNTLIPAGTGWALWSAYDINERGDIVGVGMLNGILRGFLLTRVREHVFTLVDYDGEPLANINVTAAKMGGDAPAFVESALGEFMTNSQGEITFNSLDIDPGDSIKFSVILHTEPADKHVAQLGTKYTLYLDNMLFDDFGIISWPEVSADSAQEVVMNHTTVAWNIVTSIEWDARVDYMTTLQQSFRSMANYLYDVTDGQSRIDTVVILDQGQGWDQADFRIFASNVVWPNATLFGTDSLHGRIEMPRKWYGNEDAGRAGSVSEDPLDVSDGVTYTTLTHEYGHFAFGFYDEYQFLYNGGYSTDSGRCSIIDNYGFMDNQYPGTPGVYQSEMSNASRYAFPSCWNNWHFQNRVMSCWEWFEQGFEGYYTAVPLFAPIKMPSERLLPSGSQVLLGPNDFLQSLDYDVGSQVQFVIDLTAPNHKSKFVNLLNATTGGPLGNVNVKARLANTGLSIDQGNTSDSGLIRLLGMSENLPDTVVASGRAYLAAARTRMGQPGWVSVLAEVPDLDSVEILATPMAGDYQLVSRPEFAGAALQYRLYAALPLPALPDLVSPGGITSSMAPSGNDYLGLVSDSLPSDGQLSVSTIDLNSAPLLVPTTYRILLGDGTGSDCMGPQGVCEAHLDTGTASSGRIMLLTSDFPVLRAGLAIDARQAGPAVSLVVENAGSLGGANDLMIRYNDSDLAGGYIDQEHTLRLWRFDESTRAWQLVGGAADTSHNEVVGPVASTGVYAAFTTDVPVDVDDESLLGVGLPERFELKQSYPNPFNPVTSIEYSVPSNIHVTIEIFNILGQHVRTLVDEIKSSGAYRIDWNGTDDGGQSVSTGIYLYRFSAGDVVKTKKMLLLK